MTITLDTGLLQAVSQSVEAQLGLNYPPDRWIDLERGLRGAAADLGFESMEKCARALVLAKLDRAQVDSLAAHLTIGETYFFRDPAALEALGRHILPALARERPGRAKRLRIWSAGCCTGEEPYSIAIALRRAIPDLDDWQVTILATDINRRFLEKAAAGVYGPWSFRGVPEETRKTWFRQVADGRFEVLPVIRRMVTFDYLNLVEDAYPSLATNTNAMDLVFCRNVLMYFSREQLRKVVANFHRSLLDGGRLIVSATEGAREFFAAFAPGEVPGVALYRKTAAPPPPAAAPVPQAPFPKPVPVPLKVDRLPPVPPANHAADARRLANEGNLSDALAACDRALAADKLVAGNHYLRGVILQELNVPDGAVAALRRALYLDHDFVLAHFTLGHFLLRQGRISEATRYFTNARSILLSHPQEALVPESDGITVARLLAILTSMKEALA
jgi:chemotaxis protein methyltransferase CheR